MESGDSPSVSAVCVVAPTPPPLPPSNRPPIAPKPPVIPVGKLKLPTPSSAVPNGLYFLSRFVVFFFTVISFLVVSGVRPCLSLFCSRVDNSFQKACLI